MRPSSKKNKGDFKLTDQARKQYAIRQLNKYISWSITNKGYLKYNDLVRQQTYYNIDVYES